MRRERIPPPGVKPGAPGPAELASRWLGVAYLIFFFGWPLLIVAQYRSAPGFFFIVLLPMLTAGVAHQIATMRARRRDFREIRAASFKACLTCRYPLRDQPASGMCPECGAAYTREGLERSWRWTYDTTG
jgi:hypothetical protein